MLAFCLGYGTITTDGKSFSTQDWHTAEGLTTDEFAPKKSADLSAFNYTVVVSSSLNWALKVNNKFLGSVVIIVVNWEANTSKTTTR